MYSRNQQHIVKQLHSNEKKVCETIFHVDTVIKKFTLCIILNKVWILGIMWFLEKNTDGNNSFNLLMIYKYIYVYLIYILNFTTCKLNSTIIDEARVG